MPKIIEVSDKAYQMILRQQVTMIKRMGCNIPIKDALDELIDKPKITKA